MCSKSSRENWIYIEAKPLEFFCSLIARKRSSPSLEVSNKARTKACLGRSTFNGRDLHEGLFLLITFRHLRHEKEYEMSFQMWIFIKFRRWILFFIIILCQFISPLSILDSCGYPFKGMNAIWKEHKGQNPYMIC